MNARGYIQIRAIFAALLAMTVTVAAIGWLMSGGQPVRAEAHDCAER